MENDWTKLNTIEIPTSPEYSKNFTGVTSGEGPCVVCGRDLMKPSYYVHEVGGGGAALHPSSEKDYVEDGGDLGLQPIGSDCLRAHPELKPYVHK